MKAIALQVPDALARAATEYVKAGFFRSESEVCLAALTDFVRRNRIDLLEHFLREDIEWAKKSRQEGA